MIPYEKELNNLLKIGFVCTPLDGDGVWGVFSSPEKIQKRFKNIKEIYPKAIILNTENYAKGDYIIKLYGK